ncbi:hypothetical protein AAHE18_14G173900 [Arachis hypogaea]
MQFCYFFLQSLFIQVLHLGHWLGIPNQPEFQSSFRNPAIGENQMELDESSG